MSGSRLRLDFFHDAVCAWCFNLSPRLRALAQEFDLDIRHRSFVLQDSPARMVAVFGSMARAKHTILDHWAACRAASDTPERIDIAAMRAAPFDYPHGLPAALACQAAERLGGQAAHWDMFDALQAAHLSAARNIADWSVVRAIAADQGFDPEAFEQRAQEPLTRSMVEADRMRARRLKVQAVPTLLLCETGQRLTGVSLEDLRMQLRAVQGRQV